MMNRARLRQESHNVCLICGLMFGSKEKLVTHLYQEHKLMNCDFTSSASIPDESAEKTSLIENDPLQLSPDPFQLYPVSQSAETCSPVRSDQSVETCSPDRSIETCSPDRSVQTPSSVDDDDWEDPAWFETQSPPMQEITSALRGEHQNAISTPAQDEPAKNPVKVPIANSKSAFGSRKRRHSPSCTSY